jgi:putative hydrolase of HD superfamily
MGMTDSEAAAIVRFGYEAGHLKQSARTGWWRAGIREPESVAEHSWRTAVLAYVIALAEGADAERAATIGVFHDLAETRTGDIEYVARRYVTAAADEAIAADQVRELPPALSEAYLSVIRQAEEAATPEAVCARDADKLECLLQAREYQRQGYAEAQTWADNMAEAVRTETGRALARAAMSTDPGDWWREVAAMHSAASRRPEAT